MKSLWYSLGLVLILLFSCTTLAGAQDGKKRIMVFGDSNSFGWTTDSKGIVGRLPHQVAWPGHMAGILGSGYEVIVEALGGRTTNLDAPLGMGSGSITGVGMNGAAYLPAALSSHMPLDMVIILLGTNDLATFYHRTADDIAAGLAELVSIVKKGEWQQKTAFAVPQVLLLSPPGLNSQREVVRRHFAGALEKREALSRLLKAMAEKEGVLFFDLAAVVPCAEAADGIHLTPENHAAVAAAVAKEVQNAFKDTIPQADTDDRASRAGDMVIRMARLAIKADQLPAFTAAVTEEMDAAVRLEPGVMALYAVADRHDPARLTFFELYTNEAAYQSHRHTPHFQKYFHITKDMVTRRELSEAVPVLLRDKYTPAAAGK